MIDYTYLITALSNKKFQRLADAIPAIAAAGLCTQRYGDLPQWLDALPNCPIHQLG